MNSEFSNDGIKDLSINHENEELFDDHDYAASGNVLSNCEINSVSVNKELAAKNCYKDVSSGKELSETIFDDRNYIGKRIVEHIVEENSVSSDKFSVKKYINIYANDNISKRSDNDISNAKHNKKCFTNTNIDNELVGECELQIKKLSSAMKKKRKTILEAVVKNDVDYLKSAAVSAGGLLCDDIRRKVWPKIIGVNVIETSPRPSKEDIENHHYYQQVVLDVNRSLKRFPPSIKEAQRLAMLDQLVLLIMRVLCRHPELHYYQGYHDICVTFLLVLGEDTAYYVLEKLSKSHLEVFMKESMKDTLDMLNCMYPLIYKINPQLANFMLKSEVGVGFCISWLITWFGHVLNEYDTVVRLFDFFIVSDPVMPLYLTTAIILHQQDEALQQDCDMASVHSFLSKVPDNLPFEDLLLDSVDLFKKYDYESLTYECVNNNVSKGKYSIGLVRSLAKRIKSSVPVSNITMPLVIAAAVLVTAVLYQAYKY